VVACNSATAAALPALRRRMMETTLGVDVLGVVQPEAVQAVTATRNGRIGLLATPTTVMSGAYAEAIAPPTRTSTSWPSPVPTWRRSSRTARSSTMRSSTPSASTSRRLREAGRRHGRPRLHALPRWCGPLLQRMLGATSARHLGRGARPSGRARARLALAGQSAAEAAGPGSPEEGDYRFLCTGDIEAFRGLGTRFLQMPLGPWSTSTCARRR
jgi:glutamate racemase